MRRALSVLGLLVCLRSARGDEAPVVTPLDPETMEPAVAPVPAPVEVPAPAAAAANANANANADEDAGAGVDPKAYAAHLRGLAGVAREKLLVQLEDKILAKQEAQLDRIMTGLSIVALAGFLLLFTPLVLMRRYPGRMGVLVKYSVLASLTFVVAVNLFAGVLLVMRTVQGAAGRATNPQLAIVHATFDTIDEKAEDLAIAGPTLIEPTLDQLSGGETDEPLPALLLSNVQKFKQEFTVFSDLAAFFKQVSFVFGYLPIVLTLVTLILFCMAARPTLEQIVTLPARAAAGEAGVGK